jgi:hypothetical protein
MSTTYPDEAVGFQRVLNVLRVLRGLGAQANLGGPSRFTHGSFKGFRGYSRRYRLLESGESLSALRIARYPDSGKERKRVLGVPSLAHSADVTAGMSTRSRHSVRSVFSEGEF